MQVKRKTLCLKTLDRNPLVDTFRLKQGEVLLKEPKRDYMRRPQKGAFEVKN